MAFGEVVRRELVERPPGRACCRVSFLSGLIREAGTLQVRSGGRLAVVLDLADPAAARLVFSLLRERGADAEIVRYRERRFQRRGRVRLRLAGTRSLQLLHEAGVLSSRLTPLAAPPRRVVGRACCRGAYLRGAFVAGGSVSGPRRPSHLELRAAELDGAVVLRDVAARDGFKLRTVERRGHALAYSKRRDTIRDLLVHMGAQDAALSLDEAEVVSRTIERANRLTNCDRANIARASAAAHRQRRAIERLDLDGLEPELREIAELRLRHPDGSLADLARASSPPLNRSAVARRLRLLVDRAG